MQLAIYSPADRLQPHRYKADESYEISGPEMTPVQSYLDVEAIIALAKQQSVDAIHPGYGFLSENTTFARRCGEEGIVFIGPTAKTIEVLSLATPMLICDKFELFHDSLRLVVLAGRVYGKQHVKQALSDVLLASQVLDRAHARHVFS